MSEWAVLTPLKTAKVGPALWVLLSPMVYKTPMGLFVVPAGYLTDHGSVPRMFTAVVPPVKSCLAEASILHDWFYNTDSRDVPREFADECLKELTVAQGGTKALGRTAWLAARAGGASLYNKSEYFCKLKAEGYSEYRDLTQTQFNHLFNIKDLK